MVCPCLGICAIVRVVAPVIPLTNTAVEDKVGEVVSSPPVLPISLVVLAPSGTLSRMSGVPSVPSQICQLVLATPLTSGCFPVASSSP